MKEKEKLIEKIDSILNSKSSSITTEDRTKLEEVKSALIKASGREQILQALGPLASLFKTFAEILSG